MWQRGALNECINNEYIKKSRGASEYLFKWRERGDDEERENKLRYEFNAALAMKVAPIFREFRDTRKQIMG